MPDWLNAIITLTGIALGFAGVVLTFVTFFAPSLIQGLALKSPKRWMLVPSVNPQNRTYRHKVFSGFTIEVGLSSPVSDDHFFEEWMNALYRPDPMATSYYVTLFFNGLPMDRLLFLEYDGSRNFIPVPIRETIDGKSYVKFSLKQHQFANIVGRDHFDRPFDRVSKLITESRHNPIFLNSPSGDLSEQLNTLDRKIEAFKSKMGSERL